MPSRLHLVTLARPLARGTNLRGRSGNDRGKTHFPVREKPNPRQTPEPHRVWGSHNKEFPHKHVVVVCQTHGNTLRRILVQLWSNPRERGGPRTYSTRGCRTGSKCQRMHSSGPSEARQQAARPASQDQQANLQSSASAHGVSPASRRSVKSALTGSRGS